MAALPEFKRILREDLVGVEGEWIDNLINPLNSFNEQVYSSLNRNLTIGDNVLGDVLTQSFKTPTNYIKDKKFTPFNLDWKYRKEPRAVILGSISEVNQDNIITNPISIDWKITGPGVVTIRFIVGLKNNTKYNASFVLL